MYEWLEEWRIWKAQLLIQLKWAHICFLVLHQNVKQKWIQGCKGKYNLGTVWFSSGTWQHLEDITLFSLCSPQHEDLSKVVFSLTHEHGNTSLAYLWIDMYHMWKKQCSPQQQHQKKKKLSNGLAIIRNQTDPCGSSENNCLIYQSNSFQLPTLLFGLIILRCCYHFRNI